MIVDSPATLWNRLAAVGCIEESAYRLLRRKRFGSRSGWSTLTFEAGAVLGRHPTRLWQLFSVLHGAGWASGADGVRVPVVARECVLWEPDEEHESGSDEGMVVIVVQTPSPSLPDIV